MRGLEMIRANESPRKKLHPMGQTHKHTNKQTDGHRNSMTKSAQWGRFSEKGNSASHTSITTFQRTCI